MAKIKKNKPELAFWITNISNRNVTLTDLALSVRAMSSVNLLDSKHYSYTIEQLINSATDGSIYKKSDKIVIRKIPPQQFKGKQILIDRESFIPTRQRSSVEIKEEIYEELNIADDKEVVDQLAPENLPKQEIK